MILKNSFWNLLGLGLPSVIAIPAMGAMARILGAEGFGLYLVVFSVLGYASIFDAGLNRAAVRAIAINGSDDDANRRVIGTVSIAVSILSIIASVFMLVFREELVDLLKVSPSIRADVLHGFSIVPWIIPPLLLSVAWFSYLEGRQKFGELNVYKTLTGVVIALVPVLAILIRPSFYGAVIGLLVARLFCAVAAYWSCKKYLSGGLVLFDAPVLRDLLRFGGWVTVSNLISPLMVYTDRFVLSNLLGANKVAHYTAPSDAVARLGIVPGALAKVIFPMMSGGQDIRGGNVRRIYWGLLLVVALMVVPLALLAGPVLDLWLGAEYREYSTNILRVLLIGFAFNAIAQIPYARLQAAGYSRATALIHMAEVLPYFALLFVLISQLGLLGAAIAWSIRVTVDYVALEMTAYRLMK